MTSPVESLTAGADVADAARMMVDERIRCLPIVDGDGLVGILTRRDVLRAAVAHNDQDLAGEIARQLGEVDNPDRWHVSVQAGVADIEDFGTDAAERAQASRLAATVPGVVRVRRVTKPRIRSEPHHHVPNKSRSGGLDGTHRRMEDPAVPVRARQRIHGTGCPRYRRHHAARRGSRRAAPEAGRPRKSTPNSPPVGRWSIGVTG